jgi:spore germination protein KA
MNGLTALFIDGCAECLLVESRAMKSAPSPPDERGGHQGLPEAFNENLRTNITLVRRMIRNRKLITEIVTIGKVDNTTAQSSTLTHRKPQTRRGGQGRLENVDIDFVAATA